MWSLKDKHSSSKTPRYLNDFTWLTSFPSLQSGRYKIFSQLCNIVDAKPITAVLFGTKMKTTLFKFWFAWSINKPRIVNYFFKHVCRCSVSQCILWVGLSLRRVKWHHITWVRPLLSASPHWHRKERTSGTLERHGER